ncbi:uncharacterized protein LOC113466929 [Diaphorina citri]|uniref:Uncharacterized protein LOC113466929 n=1 Tax=Diaphorina citri TaxID=121845 RepID=A0A3Q0IQH1_DIACI|nr:uncharacterized protein LOC113466929 [Diaphorina citri]
MGTCTRMDRVVRDWTLWKHINSSGDPIPMVRLKEFIPYVLKCTEEVKLTFESEPLVPGENDTEAIENEESCTSLTYNTSIVHCSLYTSLSVRFGFKALKLLDLRFTYISDSEVTIIYDLPCLTHLYLAAPTPKRLEEFSISDRSITMLCTSNPRNDENGYEQIMRAASVRLLLVPQNVSNDTAKVAKSFDTLVVTGYPSITNITLRHAAACLSGLRLLDVRGSSCTPDAVAQFRSSRPEVTLLAGPDPDPHPPGLIFDPPSPIPLLPGLRVVLHRIENQPVVAVVGGDGNNNAAEEEGEREENDWVANERERVNEERIEGGNEEEEGNEREGGNEEEEGANEERLEGNEMGNEGEEENEQRRDDEEISDAEV